jgi:[glutamine synthetase] adenylyltransferase / [glutamine synthetase]-adenylyl-L-tyrosine phosphorylase
VSARFARLRAIIEACEEPAVSEVREALVGQDDATITLAAAVAAAYPAMRALAVRRADALAAIAREGYRAPRKRSDFVRRLTTAAAADGVRVGLRRATAAERLRIAIRELDPDIEIDVTAREWSDLAEAQLEVALNEARANVEARFGAIVNGERTRNGFAVIGLGKLGGSELNAGSDIDLMFVHEADEGTVGDDALRPFDAFTKIAQRMVSTIEEHEEEGFCARVDLRLRPEGGSGPLTNSIAASAFYYETFGRGWERAALLRARAVAGDLAVGQRMLHEVAPFVWRRVVDPSVAVEMMEMVRRSRVELSEAPTRDLKLGPGGIREAEFFVQTLQLVWGGKDPGVRATNTLDALGRLRARGYMNDREARHISDGYLFLRRVEHRVQLASGVQTHLLPAHAVDRDRLARSLGYKHGDALVTALDRVRARIAERFASLAPGRTQQDRAEPIIAALESEAPGDDLLASFRALARKPTSPLGGLTRERHPQFARALIVAILDAADPDLAATTVRSFFDRLSEPGVDAYVRALGNDDRALARFVNLCGTSAYLGRSLVGHPELADLLLFSARAPGDDIARGPRMLAEEIARLPHADRRDAEVFVGATRRAKSGLELDVGLRDLAGEIDTREACRALSAMADATLEAATSWALEEAAQRRSLKGTPRGFTVLALGSLGGYDLGYGSDLDVLFVYDPLAVAPLGVDEHDAAELFGRVAQRVIRLIGTMHPDGAGYELDTRLRPSGEQGHLVVTLEGFRAYHHPRDVPGPRAQDWERQALTRLRPCAGDLRLGGAVADIAHSAAYERGAPDRIELRRIRARMEEELAKERDGRYDPKLGRGGLVDIELAVQWLQMEHGRDKAVRTTETLVAIECLESKGALKPALATTFRDGHKFLRRLEQRGRVVHGHRGVLLHEEAPGLSALARSMGYRDGPSGSAAKLLIATYRDVTNEVRAAFEGILG